jgi:hypothetical protein
MKLTQVLGDQIVATDAGLGRDPPDPVPEMIVNGEQRRGARRDRWRWLLRILEEQVPGFRSSWSHVRVNLGVELRECVKGRSGSCAYAAAAVREVGQVGSKADTRGGGSMESAW